MINEGKQERSVEKISKKTIIRLKKELGRIKKRKSEKILTLNDGVDLSICSENRLR